MKMEMATSINHVLCRALSFVYFFCYWSTACHPPLFHYLLSVLKWGKISSYLNWCSFFSHNFSTPICSLKISWKLSLFKIIFWTREKEKVLTFCKIFLPITCCTHIRLISHFIRDPCFECLRISIITFTLEISYRYPIRIIHFWSCIYIECTGKQSLIS